MKATTHPINVQPARRFSAKIGVVFGCSPTAQIVG